MISHVKTFTGIAETQKPIKVSIDINKLLKAQTTISSSTIKAKATIIKPQT